MPFSNIHNPDSSYGCRRTSITSWARCITWCLTISHDMFNSDIRNYSLDMKFRIIWSYDPFGPSNKNFNYWNGLVNVNKFKTFKCWFLANKDILFYHFVALKWRKYLETLYAEDKLPFIMRSPCHGSEIILCMRPANGRRRYIVTSSLIGLVHKQNDPWWLMMTDSRPQGLTYVSEPKGLIVSSPRMSIRCMLF